MTGALANVSGWVAAATGDYRKVLIAAGLLILAMMLAFLGIVYLRRRLLQTGTEQSTGAFTLEDLRNLHQQGQLTQEEYERARQQMIAQFSVDEPSGAANEDNLPPPGGTSSS